jgi:hypothetical protein
MYNMPMSKSFKRFFIILIIIASGLAVTMLSAMVSDSYSIPETGDISTGICQGFNIDSYNSQCSRPQEISSGLPLQFYSSLNTDFYAYIISPKSADGARFNDAIFIVDWIAWSTFFSVIYFGVVQIRKKHAHHRH